MRDIINNMSIFEAVDTEPKIVRIFDFDGTIFNSPNPNPMIWDNKILGKLKAHFNEGGYGWYQNTLTLSDEYIQDSDFNEDVVTEVKKSMADPNSVTVLLTGRTDDYTNQVKRILGSRGLVFDYYGLKPVNGKDREYTMDFKKRFIREIIAAENPIGIEMWDDRIKHVNAFNEFLDYLNLNDGVHFVDEGESYITDPDIERGLVEKLKADPRVKVSKQSNTVIYYGVLLNNESRQRLIEEVKQFIPEGWNVVCHHMTMLFGSRQNPHVQKYLDTNMDTEASLRAVSIGISDDAIAVKIDTDVPVDNKIPHVTVAIPPGGKAVNSNYITNWKPLASDIELTGTVTGFFK